MPQYRIKEGSIQHRYMLSRAKVQIFGGGYGNGKSAALCVKSIRLAKDYPGLNGVLARETYPKLNDTLRKEFFKWCPPSSIRKMPTKDDNSVYFHNGSAINFRYVNQRGRQTEEGDTTSNLLSATYDFVGIDQVEDPGITFKDFIDLMGRLRGATPYHPDESDVDETMPATGPRWMLLACNPTRNWVYKKLVYPLLLYHTKGIKHPDLMFDSDTQMPLIELFEGSTYTNEDNLPPDYIKTQAGMLKGQARKRYLMGEWAAYEGLVYGEWQDTLHQVPHSSMVAYLEHLHYSEGVLLEAIEAYDFGLVSPSCYGLGVVDHFGRVHLIDGFYRPMIDDEGGETFTIKDQAKEIERIRAKYPWLVFKKKIYADPDVFRSKVVAGKKTKGTTVAKLFKKEGISFVPADNTINSGIAKVASYLVGKESAPNPYGDTDVCPFLFVSGRLTWFNDEITNYFWKRNAQGDKLDEPMDKKDHAMDMVKYMLAKLLDPVEIPLPIGQIIQPWMFWHELEE